MITLDGQLIKPTLFPDGTSQVWQLWGYKGNARYRTIEWRFEAEREIVDVAALKMLTGATHLHMPFLPYGRQDRAIYNSECFNLTPFAALINSMGFDSVTTFDAHSPAATRLIGNCVDLPADGFHNAVRWVYMPTVLVYPDSGAAMRYVNARPETLPWLVAKKTRDPVTGKITAYSLDMSEHEITPASRVLVVDDICDGGATFIALAGILPQCEKALAVSHGIFSKTARWDLSQAGYRIFTTNSLPQNKDGYPV